MSDPSPALTPLQRETLDLLARRGDPVRFDPEFVADLGADFARGIAELGARITEATGGAPDTDGRDTDSPDTDGDAPPPLSVSKHSIATVLACEATWAAPDDFAWTAATARGTVAHKAIELSVHWRRPNPTPPELVDRALERIAADDEGLGAWLRSLDDAEHAELRGFAVERVTAFLDNFPPLRPQWRPVTEARVSHPSTGPIVLRAKVDLALGAPRGDESTRVILDFKSGRLHHSQRDDLRFYALVETLTRRLPPRLIATYSLESCRADTEEVTPAGLRTALRRTLDAIERMVEVRHEGREPDRTPGAACRWCPLNATCEPGIEYLAEAHDGDV